ncbi:MAG: ATP-binding protein [Deltaproteobacteria bacterium]|nr:ATP-binding protein [Deltaproteobacteria bacterium]
MKLRPGGQSEPEIAPEDKVRESDRPNRTSFGPVHLYPCLPAKYKEGTGLGLAIVKEVLDQMNGTIKVTSHFGRGTTVTCLIPAQSRHGLS